MDRFSAHIDRAWEMISRGQGVQALLAARQALRIDSESPEVHNLLGCIYAMDGDIGEALTFYQRAIELDDGYLDPVLNKAELLLHSKTSTDEAMQLCNLARALVSENEELVEVVLLEVDGLLNMGRVEDAHLKLMEVDGADGLSPFHLMLVGRAFFETGDVEKSKELIDQALTEDETLVDAWYCRGLIEREAGLRVKAVASFLRVLKSDAERAPLPWIEQLPAEAVLSMVKNAIERSPDDIREMLAGTEIKVAASPSVDQVIKEIDPRQAIWVEGINLETEAFERLWVFCRNLEYSGIGPNCDAETLAQVIEDEIRPVRR